MKTNQKLWIFGDSFATIRHGDVSWQLLLKNKFVGKELIVSGRGGRDIQTIVDIFLKCLHLINDDDLVIIVLPTSSRVRYPIKESQLNLEINDRTFDNTLKEYISDGFIAYHPNSTFHTNIKSKLIFPFDVIDDSMIEDISENLENQNRERYYNIVETNKIINKKERLSYTQISTFINTSEPVIQNYNDQFYSFSKAFKFKTMFLSWCNEFNVFDKSVVFTNSKIENEIGKLETENDLYIKTNGKFGKYGDWHWSEESDAKISEYIIKKNSEYFN